MSDSKEQSYTHPKFWVVDGHNDVPWRVRNLVGSDFSKVDLSVNQPEMHTDVPRLKKGGVGAQFWSVYVPTEEGPMAIQKTLEQIDVVHRMVKEYSDVFQLAMNADDVEKAIAAGKIASCMGMEGGHSVNNSLPVLRMMYHLGCRYMTLTHNGNNDWADAAIGFKTGRESTPHFFGLSKFGKQLVTEMNRMGMMVDISHVSPNTMRDAIHTSSAPVIFSHSSARSVCDHPRNVPDDVLYLLKSNEGIVMVTFVSSFVSDKCRITRTYNDVTCKKDPSLKKKEMPPCYLWEVANHIDHIRSLIGVENIGIGGDFDGTTTLPVGLSDVSGYQDLANELQNPGPEFRKARNDPKVNRYQPNYKYTDEDIEKIFHGNLLRVFKAVEKEAGRLQKLPSRPSMSKL